MSTGGGNERPGSNPTTAEGTGPTASITSVEGTVPARGVTSAEGGSAGVTVSTGWTPIPGSFADRFRYVRSLPGGGQANLFLVDCLEPDLLGSQAVLKLYNFGVQLNRKALDAIADMPSPHVVELIDHGIEEATGCWYEILEYLDGGDLYDYVASLPRSRKGRPRLDASSPQLAEVVRELLDAVVAFHAAGLSHHDIKPANVLLRTRDPLDLVLADFGLAIAADRTVYLSRRVGTIAYDSPESLGAGQGGPKRDLWSLGITISELVLGHHPFADATTGELLSDAAIRAHLNERRPIPLEGIDDEGVMLLCRGLTRYDEDARWGDAEVRRWLRGERPPVAEDHQHTAAPVIGVTFAGAFHSSRESLAAALAADWPAAARTLGSRAKRDGLLEEIMRTFGSSGLEEVATRWSVDAPKPDRAVVELIVALDPTGAPPVVRAFAVGSEDLAPLARLALSDQDQAKAARDTINVLFEQHCLEVVGQLPGQESLRVLDRAWHEAVSRYGRLVTAARSAGATVDASDAIDRAELLLSIADPVAASALRTESRQAAAAAHGAKAQPWFAELVGAGTNDSAALLCIVRCAKEAARLAGVERERQDRLARERLQDIVDPLRAWMRWVVAANLLIGIGLGVVLARADSVEAFLADDSLSEGTVRFLERGYQWAGSFWVWTTIGVVTGFLRRQLKEATDVRSIRMAQVTTIIGSVTIPILAPFGLRAAFNARRRRLRGVPSRLRRTAVWGSLGSLMVALGLVANERYRVFDEVYAAWPEPVQTWYLDNWPAALDTNSLSQDAGLIGLAALAVTLIGFAGAWWSYPRPESTGSTVALWVGAAGGIAISLAGLPVILTAVAYVTFGVLYIVAAIVGMAFILWVVLMMLDDSC